MAIWLQVVESWMGFAESLRWMVIMKVMVAEKKAWAQIGGEMSDQRMRIKPFI